MAGPGFINLTLSDQWYRATTRGVLEAGPGYGGGGAQTPERVLLEFVSANPTGPMVAANGQPAAYGDALSRILAHHGHHVPTSTTSTTRAARSSGSASRCSRARTTPRSPRAATRAITWRGWPSRSPRCRRCRPSRPAMPPCSCCWPRSRPRSRVTAFTTTSSSPSAPCTRDRRPTCSARCRSPPRAATPTATRARCGCARRPSAMRRTACSSARTASRPTSRPISAICWRSSSGASSARSSPSALTITATWPG